MSKIVEGLQQNTQEWTNYRKDKIGASDSPIIMQVSKWCTPYQLYMRKMGLMAEQEENEAMREGKRKECEALAAFNKEFGVNCKPVVMVHDEYPWMIASLDGWDEAISLAVEIKCPGKKDHLIAADRLVPDQYAPQIQHQLAVSGCSEMYYWSWYKQEYHPIHIDQGYRVFVGRDDEYIEEMIEKEKDFIRRLKEFDPPPLTDSDYYENHSCEWRYAVRNYNMWKEEKEKAERWYEDARQELIKLSGEHNSKGSGVKVQKVASKGRIDYDLCVRELGLQGIDWDAYRKPATTSWRIISEGRD